MHYDLQILKSMEEFWSHSFATGFDLENKDRAI